PGKFSLLEQVTFDPWTVLRRWRGKRQRLRSGHGRGLGRSETGKVTFQPFERLAKAELSDVHDQIDGAAAADALVPVHELGPAQRQDPLIGVPLGWVVGI